MPLAPATYLPSYGPGDDRGATDEAGLLLELLTRHRPRWHADAACREHPEVDWFPAPAGEGPAKGVCAGCLVLTECRSWSLAQGVNLGGVWGGLGPDERRARRRRRPAA